MLTLNSCPMNSHKEKYFLKRVVPIKSNDDLHLPSPTDVTLDQVSNLQSNEISYEQRNLDPSLVNLPAGNLKSTFAKAYDLLTEIVVKTGWESLLKYRAKVFVMEEEYRKDRQGSATGVNGPQTRKIPQLQLQLQMPMAMAMAMATVLKHKHQLITLQLLQQLLLVLQLHQILMLPLLLPSNHQVHLMTLKILLLLPMFHMMTSLERKDYVKDG